jgi:YD repeat-containing protein
LTEFGWDCAGQLIEGHDNPFQRNQLAELSWDCSGQLILPQGKLCQGSQLTEFGWDSSGQLIEGHVNDCQGSQLTEFGWDCSRQLILPQGKLCQGSQLTEFGWDTISPRILIAEDNVVNQKVLVRVLKRLGVENVDVVDNGQKAIDACIATSYSLVFMDVQMPVLDGFEATKAIKASCFSHSPKVVFCTAHAVEDYREMAFSVGGDGFVPKPFDLTKIGDCLKDQIGYNFCRS